MDFYRGRNTALGVFLLALTTRFGGVLITTFTSLNTYASGDVHGFAAAASYIADGLLQGTYTLPPGYSSTYHTWGTFLAPFWLLPGPSRIYARLGMALLGAVAIYNVYAIARSFASRRAAVIAALPLVFYPSIVLVHSSVLREAAIFFGLSVGTRFLVVPSRRFSRITDYGIAAILLWVSILLRPDNAPVIALLFGLASVLKYRAVLANSAIRYLAPVVISAGAIFGYPWLSQNFDSLAELRRNRARGRTEYLGDVFPETVPSVIAFSWIGAIYFLFTPFPWMVGAVTGFVAMFEAIGNLVFAIFGVLGARSLIRRNATVGITLCAGVLLGAGLYGYGTANVGTAIRHRQMLLWVIFIFGGLGIAENLRFSLDATDESEKNPEIATEV